MFGAKADTTPAPAGAPLFEYRVVKAPGANVKPELLETALEGLGAAGWEAVGVSPFNQGVLVVLKRPAGTA
jgi:hypothetical protein